MPLNVCTQESEDYQRIEKAILFIESEFRSQPNLEEIASSVHLSKFHFDRLFKRWAGISPIQFMQFLTLDYTKQRLAESASVLDASLDAGLSGPGRLHDLFVNFDAVTPGEFKRQAVGLDVSYGLCPSPFGECLIGATSRGLSFLGFVGEDRNDSLGQLFGTLPGARFTERPETVRSIAASIFDLEKAKPTQPFTVHLKGTNFQFKVWHALLGIPEGRVVSYQNIARHIGHPDAHRAVANAVAVNPVSYLIPCHRVIAKSGKIHKYRWGSKRKKALVAFEAARTA